MGSQMENRQPRRQYGLRVFLLATVFGGTILAFALRWLESKRNERLVADQLVEAGAVINWEGSSVRDVDLQECIVGEKELRLLAKFAERGTDWFVADDTQRSPRNCSGAM